MALRSCYKGIKKLATGLKWNRPGVLAADDTALAEVFFPRSEQAVLGAKNLLPNNAKTQTITGITFTVNSDGTVTANGTATALTWLQIWRGKLKKGRYIVNGCPEGGIASGAGYRLGFWNETPSSGSVIFVRETGEGDLIEITDETLDYALYAGIGDTTTVNNLVFKPMLRLATDTDSTYRPYAMTNEQLTESKFGMYPYLTNSDDLNDIKTSGIYGVTTSPAHSPESGLQYYILFVKKIDGNQLIQIVHRHDTIYSRRYYYENDALTWSSWYKFEGTVVS